MVCKRDVIHKTGNSIATASEENGAMVTDNMHKIFGMGQPCACFRVMRADRQTNKHTHDNTSRPCRGKVLITRLSLNVVDWLLSAAAAAAGGWL